MYGIYPVMIDGEEIGTLTVCQDGIMTVFEAQCADIGALIRLSVYGDKEGYLGVMLPDGAGKQQLRKRMSRAALADFPAEIRFAGRAGMHEQTQPVAPAEEGQEDASACIEASAHETQPKPEKETEEETEMLPEAETEMETENEILWRRAAGGALVGSMRDIRYLAVPLKSGVAPVGGNFEKRLIEQNEYAVFEIKNGKII